MFVGAGEWLVRDFLDQDDALIDLLLRLLSINESLDTRYMNDLFKIYTHRDSVILIYLNF